MDDDGKPAAGFRIRVSPEYKTGPFARAVWICDSHDLAILETSSDLEFSPLPILDGLPDLGTKITAYGFPAGSDYGVGLTTTGGQIIRHPVVSVSKFDDAGKRVRESLWHDAITAHGSSGGPLFSEHGVLVGLVFGAEKVEIHNGLAVPPNAVAEFIRKASLGDSVKFIQSKDLRASAGLDDPKQATVFVEVLSSRSASTRAPSSETDDLAKMTAKVETRIKEALPALKMDQLLTLKELRPLFKLSSATDMKPGDVVELKTTMTLIQLVDVGMLVRIDGVLCVIAIDDAEALREARAKIGNEIVPNVPISNVYAVGSPRDYTAVSGLTNSYFPLVAANRLVTNARLNELVVAELRRRELDKQEKAQVSKNNAKLRLRHTFTDEAGKFSVDATIVRINGEQKTVELLRHDTSAIVIVPLEKLSASDRRWISERTATIHDYGPAIATELKKAAAQ